MTRKKSKYKPKPVRLDAFNYAIESVRPLNFTKSVVVLKIKNHDALTNIVKGVGTKVDFDTLVAALNICEALAIQDIGADWSQEIRQAQDALYTMGKRAVDKNMRFLFTGLEMEALRTALEVHDAQLEAVTVRGMEKAIDYVNECIRQKKARPILERA